MEWKCITDCNNECCGIVPIPIQKYNIFKRKIKKKIVDTMRLEGHIVLMTEDGSCAFLNDKECSIYNNRPMICKLYGTIERLQCPYVDIHGKQRTDKEIIVTKKLIDSQTKDRIDIVMSKEAKTWY
jgi:Fe-S-cluster containining protein